MTNMFKIMIQKIRGIAKRYANHKDRVRLKKIYSRFREYTMVPDNVYLENLRLAARVLQLEGCVVECGVWKGGMTAGIATVLGGSRRYYLFDSFEGLPEAKVVDGPAAVQWQQDVKSPYYFDNCTASLEEVKTLMNAFEGIEFKIVKGWFETTTKEYSNIEPIALLRLDGDWYDSTMTCLENFFDRVVPGGLIIIDDYFMWDGCSRAVHDFLSKRSAMERIFSQNGVCYIQRH
jgi:hypothetical protein